MEYMDKKKVSKTFKIFSVDSISNTGCCHLYLWLRKKAGNPIARLLKNFTPKRFKDKTKYDRKRYGEIWKRYLWKGL